MSDQEWQEMISKAVFSAIGTGLFAWFKQRKPRRHKSSEVVEPDHGERIDRLEDDFREFKGSQVDMHRENQDRMREIAGELRDQRRITTTILSKMANLSAQ